MTYSFSLSLNELQRKLLSQLFIDLAKVHFTVGVGTPLILAADIWVRLTYFLLAAIVGVIYTFLSLKLMEIK